MNYSSEERWQAAQAIAVRHPDVLALLDVCLNVQPGFSSRKAARENWAGRQNWFEPEQSIEGDDGHRINDPRMHQQISQVSKAIDGMARVVARQISELERSTGSKEGVNDDAVKVSASLARTLAAVEELRAKLDKTTNADSGDDTDILAIHRRIIGKIEAAVSQGNPETVS